MNLLFISFFVLRTQIYKTHVYTREHRQMTKWKICHFADFLRKTKSSKTVFRQKTDKLQSVGLPIGGGSHAIFGTKTGGKGIGTREAAAAGNVLNGKFGLFVHQMDCIV